MKKITCKCWKTTCSG